MMNRRAMGLAGSVLLAWLAGCQTPAFDPLPSPSDPRYGDAWITRQVRIRLDADLELHPFQIYVRTDDTAVYLQGALPSERLRKQAERLAAGAPYVTAVRNNIMVVPGPPEQGE